MAQADAQMRKNLITLLKNIDTVLLQRVSDFTKGLLAASNEEEADWWDELPDSVKKSYELGMKDIEEGNMISVEDMLKKYES